MKAQRFVNEQAMRGDMGKTPEGFVLLWSGMPIAKMKNDRYLDKHGLMTGPLLYCRGIVIERFFAGTLDDVDDCITGPLRAFVGELRVPSFPADGLESHLKPGKSQNGVGAWLHQLDRNTSASPRRATLYQRGCRTEAPHRRHGGRTRRRHVCPVFLSLRRCAVCRSVCAISLCA